MNKKSLVKIINKELTILTDIVTEFSKEGDVHPFEVDMALSKIKDMYGQLLLLKETESTISIEVKSQLDSLPDPKAVIIEELPDKNEVAPTPVIPQIEPVEPIEKAKESEIIEPVQQKYLIDEPVKQDLPEEKAKVNFEDIPVTVSAKPASIVENPTFTETNKNSKGAIMADKFQNLSPSLNDMLSGINKNKDLASSLKDKPIPDLKSAIKLNDRIWFTNELFNKNKTMFEKTVGVVNQSTNLDEALAYLFSNFKWDQNQKSTISFLELVFRRFAN